MSTKRYRFEAAFRNVVNTLAEEFPNGFSSYDVIRRMKDRGWKINFSSVYTMLGNEDFYYERGKGYVRDVL